MLCIEVLRLKRAVIYIVVAGDFAAVVSVEFNNLREIVAKALHTTPNYLLLGDVVADDWMDDMIQMLEKIQKPEIKELVKKQIALLVQLGDSLS